MGVAVFAGFPLPAAAPVTVGQPPALALGLPLEPCGHQPEPCGHSGVSSPKLLCHQSGETEAGESSEQLCPAGQTLWGLGAFGSGSGAGEPHEDGDEDWGGRAMLAACSTPGCLSPALTTVAVT